MDWKTCFKGKKILVAEDDEMGRQLMKDILELMNCEAFFAVNGNEAVEQFKKGPFDLILMDIRMPLKDGIMATKEIRSLENGERRTPIIALTASLLEEEKENCLQIGIDDFVNKPIQLENLRKKMAKYLLENYD